MGGAYFLNIAGDSLLQEMDFDDEIHGAYRLSGLWCVICETSIVLWSPVTKDIKAEYAHDEILLDCWWNDGRLLIKDLQQRKFEIAFDEQELTVTLACRPGAQ